MDPPMTPVQKDRCLPMLFDYGSTYLTDYQEPDRLIPTPERVRKPPANRPRPPYLRKDIHTLTYYKDYLPFDTMMRPKDIIGEIPKYSENVPKIEVDLQRLNEVRKTRPRLVMTPALSLDDAADEARGVVLEAVYGTTYRDLNQHAAAPHHAERAPLPAQPAPAMPTSLPAHRPPRVPAAWRRESAAWDRRQNRAFCDADVEFWKDYRVYKWCPACHVTAQQEEKKRDALLANK